MLKATTLQEPAAEHARTVIERQIHLAAAIEPDVVLIDIGLPGLDGYEVARRIRAERGGRSIVLIALTVYGQAEDRLRALEAGFDLHLTKPVSPERLTAVIAETVTARRGGGGDGGHPSAR